MSTHSIANPNRRPIFIIGGLLVCLLLCACIAVGIAGAFFIVGPSTPIAAATPFSTPQANLLPPGPKNPTPLPASSTVDYKTYSGTSAPFTLQYPSAWEVQDLEASQNSVAFISPSRTASADLTFGKFSTINLSDAFDKILTTGFQDPNVIAKSKNSDQAFSAELEHTSPAFGGRVHGYIRLFATGSTYYILQFNVVVAEFEKYKEIGKTILGSLTASP